MFHASLSHALVSEWYTRHCFVSLLNMSTGTYHDVGIRVMRTETGIELML